jgi:hypothetical protein
LALREAAGSCNGSDALATRQAAIFTFGDLFTLAKAPSPMESTRRKPSTRLRNGWRNHSISNANPLMPMIGQGEE